MQVDAQVEQGTIPDPADLAVAESRSARISAAGGLYLLTMIAGAVMRFTELGEIPLSPAEASEALAAWQFLQPGSIALSIGSPAYFTLTTLLMPLLGVSDTVMRLVPAVFGFGLLFLPWLLRRQLGKVGALVCASLLAASPLNSAISRTAGGDSIALFALLLLAVSIIRLNSRSSTIWVYILAIAMGLGLASSPLFYGGLLTLAVALVIAGFAKERAVLFARPGKTTLINGLILGTLVLIGLSTRILTYPAGLGASAQLFGEWLTQFGFSGGLQSVLAPFLVLVRYEIALLLLGLVAIAWAAWRSNARGTSLVLWLLMTFGLILVQSGILSNALLATLPGYLLIGLVSGFLLRQRPNGWTWALTAGLLLLGAVLLVNITRYLRVSAYEQNLSNLWLGLLTLAAAALIIYYFWAMTSASLEQGLWLAALILLLSFEWGTAWHLTHQAANDPREGWVTQGTDDDLPLLLDTLKEVSRQATNSDADLLLLSAVDSPLLRWYLRDFWQAAIGQAVPPDAQHQAILSRFGDSDPQFGADYVGTDFGILRSGTTPGPASTTPFSDILRWWLFHETTVETIEDRVILWVRTDLVLPQP